MTTKKPPPPSYRPTAGFASVTEAVRHFAAEGKSPKEIAALTDSTTEAVRGLLQKHKQVRRSTALDGLTWPQRDKIRRTYLAYLDLMAEGLGSDRDTIHHLCRGVHVNKEPALPPEQKVDEVRKMVPETVIPASEPKPMMVMKLDRRPMDETSSARFYTLRKNGRYLTLDGSTFTDNRHHAYRGTLPQARKMREANVVAMGCSLSPFEISKK